MRYIISNQRTAKLREERAFCDKMKHISQQNLKKESSFHSTMFECNTDVKTGHIKKLK